VSGVKRDGAYVLV
jgi:hypothetical protein